MLLLLFWRSRCLAVAADRVTPNNSINIQWYGYVEYKYIVLLSSTTAAPVATIPTCKTVELGATGKRQRVTEAKAVAVLQYISL